MINTIAPTRARVCIVRAAAAASPSSGSGSILYQGLGKAGAVVFKPSSSPPPPSPPPRSISHPAPGPGEVSFNASAGKSGIVTFHIAPTPPRTIQQRLSAAGLAGIVAYGLFNTLYYAGAFLLVWFNLVKPSGGQGIVASAQAAAKTFAIVWAGSQVTKLPRAGAALLAVPLVDRLLEYLKNTFNLESKRDAFLRVIFPACIVLASAVFCSAVLIAAVF